MTYDCCSLPIMEVDAVTEKDVEIQELRRHYDFLSNRNAELYVLAQDSIQLLAKSEDRVEKLEAELSAAREKQRWISVKERLPEFFETVLGFMPERISDNIEIIYYTKTHKWRSQENGDCFFGTPSHWMPLPEAPEVRE